MAATLRPSPFRRAGDPCAAERQALTAALTGTRALINQAYSSFNGTCDADLIESYVYEINALQARYNYLLRRLKALEAT